MSPLAMASHRSARITTLRYDGSRAHLDPLGSKIETDAESWLPLARLNSIRMSAAGKTPAKYGM
jgi:hypothetical protein